MNPWNVLGIDQTNDLTLIKRAYSRLLKQAHPEEDPEGYQRLREAYDAARRIVSDGEQHRQADLSVSELTIPPPQFTEHTEEAEGISASAPDIVPGQWSDHDAESPEVAASRFLRHAAEIYDRFASRIDAEAWTRLLEDDAFSGIEVRQILRWELLGLLMDKPWLPGNIWRILNHAFSWTEQELELTKYFPEPFIQHIIWQITGPLELKYDHLSAASETGADVEAFLALRETAFNAFMKEDFEYAAEMLAKAGEIVPDDPDSLRLTGRLAALRQDWEEAALAYGCLNREFPEEEDAKLGLADALIHLRRPRESEDLYRSLLEREPEHHEALFGLSQCLTAQNRESEARTVLKNLLVYYPEDLHSQNALLVLNLKWIEELREQALSNGPDKAARLGDLAELYLQMDMPEACLTALHELQEIGGLSGRQSFWMGTIGYAWEESGDSRIPYLNHALDCNCLSPKETREALYVRSEIQFKMERYEAAKRDMLAYLTFDQSNGEVYFYIGEVERLAGHYKESVQYFEQALRLDNLAYYHAGLARTYRDSERFEDSLSEYKLSLSLSENGTFCFECGEVLKALGRYKEAADMFDKAALISAIPDAYLELAYAHYILMNYEEALSALQTFATMEGSSNKAVGVTLTGDCYFRLKDWNSAARYYDQAAEMNFSPSLLRKMTVVCLLASRRFEEALPFLQHILGREPNNEWAQLQVIRIYAELNRWWDYDKLLERYLETFDQEARSRHVWFYGGLYFYHIKQYKNALKMLHAGYALGLRGDTCSYLSLTYDSLNQWPEAAAMAREALESRPEHPDYRERLTAIEAKVNKKRSLMQKWGLDQQHTAYSSKMPLEFPDPLEEQEIRTVWQKGILPDDFFISR